MKRMACFPEVCRSVYDWSTTAGTNATADASINWAEGQLPSSVNDSARAMMAAIAAMIRDQGGYATTGGTSSAYTVSLSQTMASRVPGLVGFKAHTTNAGTCTLNVDGTGAAPLRGVTGTELAAGDITSGCIYVATWVSGSSEWLLINPAIGYLRLTGGTMTGALTLSGAPTTNLHASTKKYVDDTKTAIQAVTLTAGTGLTGGGDLSANRTISVSAGGISATELASGSVITAKIAAAAVTPTELSQPFTRGTAVSLSSTATDITGIPSWARRVSVQINAASVSGTNNVLLQLGSSGGVETTGYLASCLQASGAAYTAYTTGFGYATASSANAMYGMAVLENISGNIWLCMSILNATSSGSSTNAFFTSGAKTISGGALDRIRLATAGVNTFTGGTINVTYQ